MLITWSPAVVIKGVLFDLDGTFADTAPDLGAALNHVLQQRQLSPLPLATIRPQASHGSIGLLGIGFGITPEDPRFNGLRDEFLSHYTAHICDKTELFNGMAELINGIEARKLPWGIVTNKPHRFTLPLMQALGYADRAACLVSGDTCAHPKPHPMPMLHAAQLIKVAPDQCLYLGDDKRDMEAANASGMKGIIAQYGYIAPDASLDSWQASGQIESPLELLHYINP
jgi:phosphoglycolate phosphatase